MRSNSNRVYLDNNATTRVDPQVLDALLPYLTEQWGNPSSAYRFGHAVAKPVEHARSRVAELLAAHPQEILFTSCGTESNNTALHAALAAQPAKRHIVTTAVEHSAIIKHCRQLQKQGVEVTFLPVETDGSLDLCLLEQAIRPDTALVSVMWANNETGVLFPIEEVAAICRSKHVLCHTDAVQVAGKLPIDVHSLGVDFLSLSAHKFSAPKGVGALYVRRKTPFVPFLVGGGQETGRRGGTENVAFIVAMGVASDLARNRIPEENGRVRALRDRLEKETLRRIPQSARNGSADQRLPNTSNLAFAHTEAEGILLELDRAGICASSGSACTTGSLEPSHVLTAMGLSADRARGCVRFSLGVENTDQDVDALLEVLPGIIAKLRGEPPPSAARSHRDRREPAAHTPARR